MRRRIVWLELGLIVAGIALLAAWTRPRVEEQQPASSSQPAKTPTQGLRFLGKNAQGFEEYQNLMDGSVLIQIPGGTFTMGSNDGDEDEKPPHRVTVQPFLMARLPVSNAQYARFVSATIFDTRSYWKKWATSRGSGAAVVDMDCYDASAYCTWAGLRLPTEAEWEFAARGTQGCTFPWGNQWEATHMGKSAGEKGGAPFPLGRFPSEASPFGCLDMAGNVRQWTSSPYLGYPGNRASNRPFDPKHRVTRGSCWLHDGALSFRGACRSWDDPHKRTDQCGFRCALTP